ncbi:MAG: hypothetical protein ACLFVJ_09385 [Persicimonas sp.]
MNETPKTRDEVHTNVGRAGFGDNYFKGWAVIEELAGRESSWSLYSMAVGGPPLDDEQTALCEYLEAASMVTDPRIWIFKVCALVASYGCALVAQASTKLIFDESFLGPGGVASAAEMLVEMRFELGECAHEQEAVDACFQRWLEKRGTLSGFGVVGRPRDERQQAIEQWLVDRGRTDGSYWELSRRLIDAAERLRGLRPNVALPCAQAWLDMGYTPAQIKMMFMRMTDVILAAISHDEAQRGSAILQCVSGESVTYCGPEPRLSPRAKQARRR